MAFTFLPHNTRKLPMGWFNRTPPTSTAASVPATEQLIDVRSEGEFAGGHIDGALSLPLDQLAQTIARAVPDPATPLLLYCQSGMRSGMACQLLQQLGYTQVRNGGGVGVLSMQLGRPIRRGPAGR